MFLHSSHLTLSTSGSRAKPIIFSQGETPYTYSSLAAGVEEGLE
jgi:hypothetical protein